jgi:hypothetical protein
MDAVAKGYLKNMYFGIATDATATNLLEVSSPSSSHAQATQVATKALSTIHMCCTALVR